MTDLPTIAREAAEHCEARLIAFRKTKEGTVVSFIVHQDDVTEKLNAAKVGDRAVLAMVWLGENEEPKK